uniref:Uncharacterized protein n=1 Tax=Candidatus Kentrum sp. TUN TaxID=2126343 RepID=A0A451A704_9GAMM|nr:MAG: hypothetical protein BECKTUN1418F_GA0071002_12723 [Candidatus Kentron sp. TUN]VFK70907.1 MAG: hypothetical protein BECKTUN1418E_GA0071001_12753 [Candidatus Kentron sp. TUN]
MGYHASEHLQDAPDRGEGWIAIKWRQPAEGGKAAAYKVQRRAHQRVTNRVANRIGDGHGARRLCPSYRD